MVGLLFYGLKGFVRLRRGVGVTAKRCVLPVASSSFVGYLCVLCFSGSSMGKLNLTCAVVSDGYVIIEIKMCFWDIIFVKCFITREVFAFDYKKN